MTHAMKAAIRTLEVCRESRAERIADLKQGILRIEQQLECDQKNLAQAERDLLEYDAAKKVLEEAAAKSVPPPEAETT